MSSGINNVNKVHPVYICDFCLDGKGGCCHTPGCMFIRTCGPEWELRTVITDFGGKIERLEDLCS